MKARNQVTDLHTALWLSIVGCFDDDPPNWVGLEVQSSLDNQLVAIHSKQSCPKEMEDTQ